HKNDDVQEERIVKTNRRKKIIVSVNADGFCYQRQSLLLGYAMACMANGRVYCGAADKSRIFHMRRKELKE
ncbi:MAG: hypothetical protein ACI4PM_05580, partial [Butyricicoccus sp.]